jgi:outer membrane protein insertion porin family
MREVMAVCFALLGTALLSAQTSGSRSATAPTIFEGQKVISVELVTDPHIDTSSYENQVEQKAGQPYSAKAVQSSIEALEKTGRFNKVEVEMKSQSNGVTVNLVMEPAFYVGIIEFPGRHLFSYTRLLQVVNMPPEDPYKAENVTAGAAALLKFFQHTGYFEAEVRPETRFDNARQLVNVIYYIQLNKRAKVGAITVSGPSPQESQQLVNALKSWGARLRGDSLKPGTKYTQAKIQSATQYLRGYLVRQNRLIKRLRLASVQYHPETRKADVNFEADLGPPISVRLVGAKLTWFPLLESRNMHKLIPIYDEGSVDPELVQEGRQNLVDYFQKKGYFDVKVTSNVQQQNKIFVVYDIAKGKRHKVAKVAFHGNHHFSEDQLESVASVKEGHFILHGTYSEKLLKKSSDDLKKFYQDNGYLEADVKSQVVDKEPKLYVTFNVTEGEQTIVNSLDFQGNRSLSEQQLRPRRGFRLRDGQPYSPSRLGRDRERILATYLNSGYPRATFDSRVTPVNGDKHRVDVTYNINEGQQVRISQVMIIGQRVTREGYINRAINIEPEEPLSQEEVLASESNLYNDGVFDWTSVGPRKPITDQTDEPIVVKVHEAKRNSITYGFGMEIAKRGGNLPAGTIAVPGLPTVGVGSNVNFLNSEKTFISPRGSVEYIRRNLFGLGQILSTSALLSRLDQRGLFTYSDPHFRWTNWDSLFSASAERTTENPLYTARLGDVSFQLQRYLDQKHTRTLQVRYDFNRTSLSNLLAPGLISPEDQSVRLSTVSGTYIVDTRDKPLDAHRGTYQTLDFGVTPEALGSTESFVRFLGSKSIYKGVKNMTWANRVQLGLASPFAGSHVPESQRFFTGGGNSIRGFPINGAGPQRTVPVCSDPNDPKTCSNITVPVGGIQLFIVNSELRFPTPIIKNLGGVVFYDGGNVYQHINFADLVNQFSNTVGFGIRYSTPIGPVRIDIGRNLNPVPGLKATQFFVTLGQAF